MLATRAYIDETAQLVTEAQYRIAHLCTSMDEARGVFEKSRELLAQSTACLARADAVLERSRKLLGPIRGGPPAAAAAKPETYAGRLRVANRVVRKLRAAGMRCVIFDDVQPMQPL